MSNQEKTELLDAFSIVSFSFSKIFTDAIEANLKAIEKWNGILPQVTGAGAVPFIGVSDLKKN